VVIGKAFLSQEPSRPPQLLVAFLPPPKLRRPISFSAGI